MNNNKKNANGANGEEEEVDGMEEIELSTFTKEPVILDEKNFGRDLGDQEGQVKSKEAWLAEAIQHGRQYFTAIDGWAARISMELIDIVAPDDERALALARNVALSSGHINNLVREALNDCKEGPVERDNPEVFWHRTKQLQMSIHLIDNSVLAMSKSIAELREDLEFENEYMARVVRAGIVVPSVEHEMAANALKQIAHAAYQKDQTVAFTSVKDPYPSVIRRTKQKAKWYAKAYKQWADSEWWYINPMGNLFTKFVWSWTGLMSVGTSVAGLFVLGPWGVLAGLIAFPLSLFGQSMSVMAMAYLFGSLGFTSMGWIILGWTFMVGSVTALITYGLAYRGAKATDTPMQRTQASGSAILGAFDTAWEASKGLLPSISGRTLSYMRNLVALCRDVPKLALGISAFWSGLMFDVKSSEVEKPPLVYVVTRDKKYELKGLSASLKCADLAMAGFSFVHYRDAEWRELDVGSIGAVEIASLDRVVLVETLFFEDGVLDRFETLPVATAAFDPLKRELVEREPGQKQQSTIGRNKKKNKQVVSLQQARHNCRQSKLYYESAKAKYDKAAASAKQLVTKVKAGERVSKTAQTRCADWLSRTKASYLSSKKKFSECKERKRAAKMASEDYVPKELSEDLETTATNLFSGSVPPIVDSFVSETKGKEKEKEPFQFTAPGEGATFLDKIADLIADSEDKEEANQAGELTDAKALGVRFQLWIKSGWAFTRVHWYWFAGVGVTALFLLATLAYFIVSRKKERAQAKSTVDQAGNILKYDVHPDDSILKYMVDGRAFGFNQERFNELAKGKKPGEVIAVDVLFAKGGPKKVNAVVGEAETIQAVAGPYERLAKDHPLRNTERNAKRTAFKRRMQKAEILVKDDQAWKTVKHQFEFGIPRVCHYSVDKRGSINDDDKQPIIRVKDRTSDLVILKSDGTVTDVLKGEKPVCCPVGQMPQSKVEKSTLVETPQAFKNMRSCRPLYMVDVKNEAAGVVVKVPTGLLMPRHYVNPAFGESNAMSRIGHGEQVCLRNVRMLTASQVVVWERDKVIDTKDTDDAVIMPLAKPLAHMPMLARMAVVPNGTYNLWAFGCDPDSHEPFMTRLLGCVKNGNTITYQMDNKAGICDTILCLDIDAEVCVAIHVRGNVKAKRCTASAFSSPLIKACGYTQQVTVVDCPGVVYEPPKHF